MTAHAQMLRGHDGPVWAVAWAHPKFGTILASASFDGRVLVWKEQLGAKGAVNNNDSNPYGGYASQYGASGSNGGWEIIKEHALHSASVNAVAWAPHELGAVLACGSSDGQVSVLTFNANSTVEAALFTAHPLGVNAVSWSQNVGAPSADTPLARRFVTGGCDNLIKIWAWSEADKTYALQDTLTAHSDWVRDVAWSPSVLARPTIASCGQDKMVYIHTQDVSDSTWSTKPLKEAFADSVWRVSWNLSGSLLAVSCADGQISIWKETPEGEWVEVGDVNENK